MPNKQTRELRSLDRQDLELRLQESKDDLLVTRFNLATRKTENSTALRNAKRQIARIKTLLAEPFEET